MIQAEKITAMELLWQDLTHDEKRFDSPSWHKDELDATERRVDSGEERFMDWQDAKKRLRQKPE